MNTIRLTYTPTAANLTRYASNVTGGTWALTQTTTADGLAHTVTIRNDSATDHSGKTALLTGIGVNGLVQTETLALPGVSATVTSVKYYKGLTTIVPSSSIGADTMDIGMGAAFVSAPQQISHPNGIIGIIVDVSGTATYTIQFTGNNIQDPDNQNFTWQNSSDPDVVNATASNSSNFVALPPAMRLLVSAQSGNPTIVLTITQRNA